MNIIRRFREELATAWQSSRPLTAVAIAMVGAFVASAAGLVLDPRVITGAPGWLKPAKFAISSAIYTGTLAWLFRYLQVWPLFVRILGALTAAVLVLEVGIIDFQAARGTTSHFNVSTPLDGALWATMGVAIAVLWTSSIGTLVALFRQPFVDRSFGWALRLGMLVTVIGSASGGLMVTPTEQQRVTIAQTHHAPAFVGGHTVGAPDGGPGLPGVGWSRSHGDLRIPHFLGLHALQVIPLFYFLRARRRRIASANTPYIFIVSASYFALIGILTWQALRGQSIVEPDSSTSVALLIWLALTAAAMLLPRTKSNGYQSSPLEVV